MPITLLERLENWLISVLSKALRTDSAGVVSVRTDPTINDIDIQTNRKYIIERVVSTANDWFSIDFTPSRYMDTVIRYIVIGNESHAEQTWACVRLYPRGFDGDYVQFPSNNAAGFGGPDSREYRDAFYYMTSINQLVISYPETLRLYNYAAAAGRTLKFVIAYDEVSR